MIITQQPLRRACLQEEGLDAWMIFDTVFFFFFFLSHSGDPAAMEPPALVNLPQPKNGPQPNHKRNARVSITLRPYVNTVYTKETSLLMQWRSYYRTRVMPSAHGATYCTRAVVVPDGEPGGSSPWQVDLVPASVLSGLVVFALWFARDPAQWSGPHICGLSSPLWFKGISQHFLFLSQSPVLWLHNANISSVFWNCLKLFFTPQIWRWAFVWCCLGSLNQYVMAGYSVFTSGCCHIQNQKGLMFSRAPGGYLKIIIIIKYILEQLLVLLHNM